ncbi:pentatricopeptide repeat-containing protein At3g49740 [Cynara cardunculus var. scolymus]|uniref:pentatricopeptide repeat-containing protein At3g49740 n=1 Tax=Cynara cardunculus var. scolymus TaxID=59895 RepID=UPI000D6234C5|nr:pentatricopeptide repeat-containing protein At3g49740 [Cynara cardunculus var. scolymus]
MNSELIKVNCLLAKLTKSQQYTKTLQLFHQIQSSQYLKPDQYTLSTTLTATANLRDVAAGNQVHAHVIRTGFKIYPHVANTLLFLYAKSMDLVSVKRVFDEIKIPDVYSWTTLLSACTNLGEVEYACHLLDQIPQRNEAVWNAVITGCADNEHSNIALDMFQRMHLLGIRHDNYSFASVLSLCSSELINFGREVHSLVIKTGFLVRSSVKNALITMYFNFGSANQAYDVFEETEELGHDQITYNAMIAGLVSLGRDEDAFMMFKNMQKVGHWPTERTFVSVMSSCSCGITAIQLHANAIKTGFEDFNAVSNTTITMYSACGDLQAARMVFEKLEAKDRVSWNTMITSYAQENLSRDDAIVIYLQMQHQGIGPDEFTIGSLLATLDSMVCVEMILAIVIKYDLISKTEVSNALISTLSRLGALEDAYTIFTEMNSKNLISWNSMISGFHSNGCSVIGLELFSEMLISDLTPDVYTLNIVLSICATILAFRNGKEIHGYVLKFHYLHEPSLGNALIALYAKCGILDWSIKVFKSMIYKDVVSWNSMISAYGNHGRGEDAVLCFEEMQKSEGVKVEPDHTTFTTALTACSHAGLVDHGVEIFNSMVNKYGLEPEIDHFSCIVDLLGRAGFLDAAENLMKSGRFNVHSSIWWNLFSSCAAHGDFRLGRIVAGFLLELEEDKSGVYVVLSNILANAGYWEEAADMREMMKSYGVVKQPGYSWIRS